MSDQELRKAVTVPRVVLGAMGMGIVAFAAVAVVLGQGGQMTTQPELARILLPVLALMAAPALVAFLLVRNAAVGKLRSEAGQAPDRITVEVVAARLVPVTIIGGALAEGVSLFGTVAYLLTGQALALAAPAVGIIALVLLMPSLTRIRRLTSAITGRIWEG